MISVIVPTYKRKELLIKNLKENLKFLKDCQVIVVNDDPKESIKSDLKDFAVILIENKKNLGFAGAVNRGVNKARYDYVMLLNSDTKLLDESFKEALLRFKKNKNLFAVSFSQKEKNGEIVGRNKIFWKNGFVQHSKNENISFGYNAWAEGGASIFDKEKFLKIGGFDSLYSPFYWEDIDLSYRAWKAGYQVLFDPKILVEHHHESTIGSYFSKNFVNFISYRNQLIFIWKNITDKDLLLRHTLLFLPALLYYAIKTQALFLKSFLDALKKLTIILAKRNIDRKMFKLTDAQVLSVFN